jgi:hypothetical protein
VYIVAERTGLVRLDRATGLAVWTSPNAWRFLAVNPKFVYATDRMDRLLVLDRATGTQLSRYDTSAFNVVIVNDKSDRLFLAAHDGTILCLHDRGFPAPVSLLPPIPVPAAKPDKSPGDAKAGEE